MPPAAFEILGEVISSGKPRQIARTTSILHYVCILLYLVALVLGAAWTVLPLWAGIFPGRLGELQLHEHMCYHGYETPVFTGVDKK